MRRHCTKRCFRSIDQKTALFECALWPLCSLHSPTSIPCRDTRNYVCFTRHTNEKKTFLPIVPHVHACSNVNIHLLIVAFCLLELTVIALPYRSLSHAKMDLMDNIRSLKERNVQLKARVLDLHAMEQRLFYLTESLGTLTEETDFIFNCRQGRLKLRVSGRNVRGKCCLCVNRNALDTWRSHLL